MPIVGEGYDPHNMTYRAHAPHCGCPWKYCPHCGKPMTEPAPQPIPPYPSPFPSTTPYIPFTPFYSVVFGGR